MTERRTSAEEDHKDLARGAGVTILGSIARIAPRAIFLILAGRFYGESGFGAFTFATAIVETAAGFSLFGMKRSLFRFMGEAKARGESLHRPIVNGVALALTTAVVLTLAGAVGAPVIARTFGLPSAGPMLFVLTMSIPFIVLSDILLVAIRFTRQMRFEVFARSLVEPIVLTLALILIHQVGANEIGLAYAYLVSLVSAAAVSLFFFTRVFDLAACLRTRPRWSEVRQLASFSGPTAGYELLMMLADKADVFLVSYFGSAATVGVYGMARQFATITKKIKAGFDRILPTVYSESLAAGETERASHQLGMVSRWILSVQLPVVLVFLFFATPILGWVQAGFATGGLVLVLLMIGDAINGSLSVSELPFLYLRPSSNIVFGAATLALNVGIGFFLVRAYGAAGAATSVLIASLVVNLVRVTAGYRAFGQRAVSVTIAKPLVAAVFAAGIGWSAEQLLTDLGAIGSALQLILILAAYAGGLALLGLEPEDKAQVERLLAKVRPAGL
ncbi:MAG: oligosaccharide flippase family protein [Longimicrobiales bacterium]